MLWLEVFGKDITLEELKGLYQLKNPVGLFVAYFSTWATHGTLVEIDPTLKKCCKYGWFVADGDWGQDILVDNEHLLVISSFNKSNITWIKRKCPIQEISKKVTFF